MTVRSVCFLPALLLLVGAPALAQDDDLPEPDIFDEEDEDDEEEAPAPARPTDEETPIDLDDDPEPGEIDDLRDVGGPDDEFFEEEIGEDRIGGEGVDSARIYREQQDTVDDFLPDEELLAWERYLKQYPKTLFRNRIDQRMQELESILYEQDLSGGDGGRLDADQRELLFSQALTLENIDPRQRFMVGFEWGLPDYVNFILDYEHPFRRDLSVHVGLRRRYTGFSLELGPRFALVKSSRTQTLLTAMADFHLNAVPSAFFSFRPQLAFGQAVGPVDFQIHAGADLDTRVAKSATVKIIGGANATIDVAENVSVFLEGNVWMGGLTWAEGDSFRFNTGSFGLKFYPKMNGRIGDLEVNIGASAPFATNYWMYHFGSIMGQVVYYLDRPDADRKR